MQTLIKPLTRRQKEILGFITRFIEQEGYCPSLQEIANGMYIGKTTAFQHVQALQEKGYVTVQSNKSRTIRIVRGA